MNKILFVVIILWVGMFISAHAQSKKPKKNRFEYFSSVYNYFDGSPMIQNKNFGNREISDFNRYRSNKGVSLGLSLTHRVDSIKFYKVSLEYVGIRYSDATFQGLPGNAVHHRVAYYIDAMRMKRLLDKKHHSFTGFVGGNVRIGYEALVASYGVFDVHFRHKDLRDLGITAGGIYQHDIFKNLNASFQVKLVQYLFRWDRGDKDANNETYRQGSTTNLLGLTFGLGYSF